MNIHDPKTFAKHCKFITVISNYILMILFLKIKLFQLKTIVFSVTWFLSYKTHLNKPFQSKYFILLYAKD